MRKLGGCLRTYGEEWRGHEEEAAFGIVSAIGKPGPAFRGF